MELSGLRSESQARSFCSTPLDGADAASEPQQACRHPFYNRVVGVSCTGLHKAYEGQLLFTQNIKTGKGSYQNFAMSEPLTTSPSVAFDQALFKHLLLHLKPRGMYKYATNHAAAPCAGSSLVRPDALSCPSGRSCPKSAAHEHSTTITFPGMRKKLCN